MPRQRGMATLLAVLILTIVAGAIAAGIGYVRYDAKRTEQLHRDAQARLLFIAAMNGESLQLPDGRGRVSVEGRTGKDGRTQLVMEVEIDGVIRHAVIHGERD
ncbi:MAG: hypothetical protein AAGD32_01270 [Planctomycetota bacterium]